MRFPRYCTVQGQASPVPDLGSRINKQWPLHAPAFEDPRLDKSGYLRREMETTGELPKIPIEDTRTTIATWQEKFINNARSENLNQEIIRKYDLVFRQLIAFAGNEGIRFASELDLPALQRFRGTWKDGSLSRSKNQERLRSIFKFAVAQKWVRENPALSLGKIKVGSD